MAKKQKRNRKKAEKGFKVPALLIVMLVLAVGFGGTNLWLSSRSEVLEQQIVKLEKEKVEVQKKVVTEEYNWARLKSRRNLETALRRHQLNMRWPEARQVVRVRWSSEEIAGQSSLAYEHRYAYYDGNRMNDR